MSKSKRVKWPTGEDVLEDLGERLEQFIELNNIILERGTLKDKWEIVNLESQTTAFSTVLGMIQQIKKRGELWRGGYEDNVGVVYTDQVKVILDNLKGEGEKT